MKTTTETTVIPDYVVVPDYVCGCGEVLTAATTLGPGKVPGPGSLSICFTCGARLIFNADLTQREMTEDEIVALPAAVLQRLARAEEQRRTFRARRDSFGTTRGNA